jgi:phosphate transport system permease protein
MATLKEYIRRGEPAVWFTGTGLGIAVLMIVGMLALILVNGLGFFWPKPLTQLTLQDGTVLLGELVDRQGIPKPGTPEHLKHQRVQIKVGNRDVGGQDFRWVDEDAIAARALPQWAVYVERREYGPFIGIPSKLVRGETEVATGAEAAWEAAESLLAQAGHDRERIHDLEQDDIGAVNYALERERLNQRRLDLEARQNPGRSQDAERRAIDARIAALQQEYAALETRLAQVSEEASATSLVLTTADGTETSIRTIDVFRAYPANQLTTAERASVYLSRLWEFVSGDPRESNTEGGIFPAIFGTVMMVLIMSILAVPFGVVAALYLREYAKQGTLVRVVRIAVNNLAGVPSIVFGVFGLGFFVYFLGGAIDQAFFAERLPTPTFGTGGILWASLTLGLLTVPVVIVAAEEALAAVPRSMREASLATGATKFQTIVRVVLPAAAPGILTGLILAMARGAGEVAPLMVTGVVKLAPDLPLDGFAPFLHLERKFMHLGFHIYDVGFQSPNVEAAKPMVYATTILLLLIVVALNLTAIIVRNRLRKKYQTGAF